MRKNKILTVYSILVSIIFVAAVAFFGVNLYKEYSEGYVRTRRTFEAMNSSVKKSLRSSGSITDIQSKIATAVDSFDDYIFLEVKSDGKTIYMYSPKGITPDENTNMIRIYFDSSKIGDNFVYVNAAMYTLRPSIIAKYAKISFIVILIFTVLTILLILYISIFVNTSSSTEIIEDETTPADEPATHDDEVFEEDNIDESVIPESEDTPEETNTPETSETNESIDFESYDVDAEKTELPVSDDMPAEIEKPETSSNPEGLFSPTTGFGWESYLMTRLENELVRATSLEFDLILFLIKIKNTERTPELMEKLSEILINTFQFKDLIFEYKEDGFAAIKTNCSIDDAIPIADKLHSEISTVITELGGKCYIGLTSRTIRLVSAERLLKEADSALAHALEDENAPIIAFRANSEKYLDFVEGRD